MQFVQFKIPAVVDGSFVPNGWIKTKHKPHITFFEIKVAIHIVDQVIGWMMERSQEIEALVSSLCFDHWTVFYKRKLNLAVLTPQGFDVDSVIISPVISARCELMKQLFFEFGCSEPIESSFEGLPLYLYHHNDQLLFSCNKYNRPEVWYPHVSVAIKFQNLDKETNDWPKLIAKPESGLFYELLDKL